MCAPGCRHNPQAGEPVSPAVPVRAVQGDITGLHVDAIVNAANRTLLGGGGVDRAIHRAAGPGLLDECRKLGGCATGDVRATKAYNLDAKIIIHAVGPLWHGGLRDEEALLCSCYERSLDLARARGCRSIAFPSLSTGAFGFPPQQAARLAFLTVQAWLQRTGADMEVIFCAYTAEDLARYERLLLTQIHG
jgi:O-acetyl-ADP-ribose deacetylase